MPLAAGTRVGNYEIVGPIGKGGMGEVYRARDTKLERDVAIKVLPDEFARDRERLERFEREARLLAQLNHANIATIHGLEEHDGQQFLVMELIEGETLAERISEGPLSLDEAVPLFIQIADGLEAAHEKGILHRDLKPSNIKIGSDGKPKILDFGLAKAFLDEEGAALDSSQSPTLTKGTALGAILGTAAYMSPEQARGKLVDGRTDVWAFGCCLYESLTGERAFGGDSTADIFAAIMNRDPRWDALPARIRKLLERCLHKDVHQRLRGLEHARLELADLTSGEPQPTPSRRTHSHRLPWIAAFVATALALVAILWPPPEAPSPSPIRFSVQLPAGDRLMGEFVGNLAISRDGRRLAYVGIRGMDQYRLFVRSLDRVEPEPIPGTEGAGSPFFSPDGLSVGFSTVMGPLKRVAISGGTPVELVASVGTTLGVRSPNAFWAPDGYIYFSSGSRSGIFRIREGGGAPETVVSLRTDLGDVDLNFPHVLPGGRAVLFVVQDGSGQLNIAVEAFDSGERHRLVENGTSPHYAATGHLVFARTDKIMAVPFDLDGLTVEGNPTVVVEGLKGSSTGPSTETFSQFALSEQGTLAYVEATNVAIPVSQLVEVDRRGEFTPLIETPRRFWDPRWSPDGSRIAVSIFDDQRWDLWTHDLSRGTLTRLTFRGPVALRPLWSADGSRLLYVAGSVDANGGSEPELIAREYVTAASSVSRDGQYRVYRQSRPETGWDIVFQRDADAADEFAVYLNTPFDELHPVLSPDGSYLAYTSNESGRIEVFVDTFPQRSKKVQISNEGGTEPVWSPDGTELFYRTEKAMMRVGITTEPELTVSRPSLLFEGDFQLGFLRQTANYDISPDGQSFVMLRAIEGSRGSEIAVIINWFGELERLVPVPE